MTCGRLVHQELEVGAQRAVALHAGPRRPSRPRSARRCRARACAAGRGARAPGRACAGRRRRRSRCGGGTARSASASSTPPNSPSSAGDAEQAAAAAAGPASRPARPGRRSVAIISLLSAIESWNACAVAAAAAADASRVGRPRGDPQDAAAALGRGVDVGGQRLCPSDLLGAREVDARLRRLGVGGSAAPTGCRRRRAPGPAVTSGVSASDGGRLVLGGTREDRGRTRDDRRQQHAEHDPASLPGQGDEVPQVHGSPILGAASGDVVPLYAGRARAIEQRALVGREPLGGHSPGAERGRAPALILQQRRRAKPDRRARTARARSPRPRPRTPAARPSTSRFAGMSEATTTTSRAIASRIASDCPSHADQCRYTVASASALERLARAAASRSPGSRRRARRRRRRRSLRRSSPPGRSARAPRGCARSRPGGAASVIRPGGRRRRARRWCRRGAGAVVELGDPVADHRDARRAQDPRGRAPPPPRTPRRASAQRRATSASSARTRRAGAGARRPSRADARPCGV